MKKFTFAIISSFITLGAIAQNCQPAHMYYRDITIDNTANAAALTDYQVQIMLNTGLLVSQGKLNADGSDLRIYDVNCNPLHFYMDSTASSMQNSIWVKVPSVPANSSVTIQLYYGNPNETISVSNGDSTFMFFDDFEDGVVDANKWTPVGNTTALEAAGMMTFSGGANTWPASSWQFIRSNMAFSTPVVVETGIMQNQSSGLSFIVDGTLERYIFRTNSGDDSLRTAYASDTTSGTVYADQNYPEIVSGVTNFADLRARAWINSSNYLEFTEFTNVNTGQTNTATKTLMQFPMNGFNVGFTSFQSFTPVSSSYLRVRRSDAGDVAAAVSGELSVPVGIEGSPAIANVRVMPNPSNGNFMIDLRDAKGKVNVSLTDIAGRTIIAVQEDGGSVVPVSINVEAGTYLITISDGINSTYQRLVIK